VPRDAIVERGDLLVFELLRLRQLTELGQVDATVPFAALDQGGDSLVGLWRQIWGQIICLLSVLAFGPHALLIARSAGD
jgi:hypothetical protein